MRADLAFEPVEDRCRRCAKKMLADLGQDVFGNSSGTLFCPSCGMTPQASDYDIGNIRAAVAAVTRRPA